MQDALISRNTVFYLWPKGFVKCIPCARTLCRKRAFQMWRTVMCKWFNVLCGHLAYCMQRWRHSGGCGLAKMVRATPFRMHIRMELWLFLQQLSSVNSFNGYYWALTMYQDSTCLSTTSSATHICASCIVFVQEIIPRLIDNKYIGKSLAWKSKYLSSSNRSNREVLYKSTSLSPSFIPLQQRSWRRYTLGSTRF